MLQHATPIVQTRDVHHSFRQGQKALSGLELSVPEGSIFGLVGPNGSGKTTALCLLTGLYRSQQGSIQIMGRDLKNDRLSVLLHMGVLIESPSLYAHLSARDNLRIYHALYGVGLGRVEQVLELTGLAETGRKKVKHFSLGMKQRLAVALAILPDPKLLILDEPTNGLDPAGIADLRQLLVQLNRENNMTILLSSHILTEIEKICTHIAVLRKGELLYQGSLPEFRSLSGEQVSLEQQFLQLTNINA
jgi:ABC-2 type transport system ATP-binding protein